MRWVLLPAVLLCCPPAYARAALPLVGAGTWSAPLGAASACVTATDTLVRCRHTASAGTGDATTSTCRTQAVNPGGVAVLGACTAVLSGTTAGPGRVVGEGWAPGCVTSGVLTAEFTFRDASGAPYPPVPVSVSNVGGTATFHGYLSNAYGAVVAAVSGTFTQACGSTTGSLRGEFTGSYETV